LTFVSNHTGINYFLLYPFPNGSPFPPFCKPSLTGDLRSTPSILAPALVHLFVAFALVLVTPPLPAPNFPLFLPEFLSVSVLLKSLLDPRNWQKTNCHLFLLQGVPFRAGLCPFPTLLKSFLCPSPCLTHTPFSLFLTKSSVYPFLFLCK